MRKKNILSSVTKDKIFGIVNKINIASYILCIFTMEKA